MTAQTAQRPVDETAPLEQLPGLFATQAAVLDDQERERETAFLQAQIADLDERFERLKAVASKLGIESESRIGLTALRDDERSDLERRIRELATMSEFADLDARFRRMNMSFLRWRQPDSEAGLMVPRFAVFNLDNPVCSLKAKDRWNEKTASTVPVTVQPFWQDVLDAMQRYLVGRQSGSMDMELEVSVKFAGIIPQDVRKIILDNKELFDEMLLVTEAPQWQTLLKSEPRKIPVGDPLVIARKGEWYWLLAAFDLSPAEHFIRQNCTYDV